LRGELLFVGDGGRQSKCKSGHLLRDGKSSEQFVWRNLVYC
jgi:hypothetical protein